MLLDPENSASGTKKKKTGKDAQLKSVVAIAYTKTSFERSFDV